MARGHAEVVVVAAGTSQRFGSDKLDADIGGRPLLAWTLDGLAACDLVERIVVVTSADRIDRLRTARWLSPKVADVVVGGIRRQESVAEGLAAVGELPVSVPDEAYDRIVLVHDGARPLVSAALVESVIHAVAAYGAAAPVLPISETVKRLGSDGRILETVDRTELSVAQTPQGARLGLFNRALRDQSGRGDFTDEAALLEASNIPVHAIPGDPANIKVTLPSDLARVGAVLSGQAGAAAVRVGFGHDSHPFGPGSPLALGGLAFDGAPRLSGHSDGDVALHAIAGAILGAAGLGDLGRLFPAGLETPRGIASTELLTDVVGRAAAAGLRVANLDVTIVAARPHLGSSLPAIGRRVAELLGVEAQVVNVKASTGNLAGMEGAGRGIGAQAVVTLVPVG